MTPNPAETSEVNSRTLREPLFTANFLLASVMTLASFSSFYFLLATLPVYIMQIGGNEAEVGLIIGIFSAAAVVLRPFVGKGTDGHGKRPFIVVGSVLLTLSSGFYALVATTPMLLGLRVFHGIGWASVGTATSALIADLAPRSRRGEAMGYYGMFSNLAMAVGPALGVMLMTSFSFPVLFASSAAVAALALCFSLTLREPEHFGLPTPSGRGRQGVIERSALFPSAVLALTAITYGSIVSFLPIYAVQQGIPNPGVFFTAYALILLVARGFTGQLSDRYGRAAVIAPGLVLAAAGLWLLAFATSLPLFLAVAVLYGLAFAAIQPSLMALVVDRAAPNRRGAAMGTFSTAMDLGIGAGSVAWGFVAQAAGFQALYLASGGVAALTLLLFLVGMRTRRQTPSLPGSAI